MKKIISILLAIIACFSLTFFVGCNNEGAPSEQEQQQGGEQGGEQSGSQGGEQTGEQGGSQVGEQVVVTTTSSEAWAREFAMENFANVKATANKLQVSTGDIEKEILEKDGENLKFTQIRLGVIVREIVIIKTGENTCDSYGKYEGEEAFSKIENDKYTSYNGSVDVFLRYLTYVKEKFADVVYDETTKTYTVCNDTVDGDYLGEFTNAVYEVKFENNKLVWCSLSANMTGSFAGNVLDVVYEFGGQTVTAPTVLVG